MVNLIRKKVLITGASRGIGRACACILAREGYDLYLTCLDQGNLLKTLGSDLEKEYAVTVQSYVCDAGNEKQVHQLFTEIECPDILINNAGFSFMGLMSEMSVAQWHQVMNTDLNSVFYACREVIPEMVCRKSGKIITISSVWGEKGAAMETAYSTAKAGVNGLTRALARELAPSGIQVNAVAFGFMDTDMNRGLSKEEWDAICADIPMGRAGTPSEAAHMVLQIINSPDYLTGQVITMDGGWI